MKKQKPITVPIVRTLRQYQLRWLSGDVLAGISVAAVAVPQAMAYAKLAGVALSVGLYAAMAAMVVYAIFSTTRRVIVGPDAAMAALSGAAVAPLALGSTSVASTLVAGLAVAIGAMLLIARSARIAFVAEFLSRPILLGYMAGLGVVVITTQLPNLLGLGSAGSAYAIPTFSYIARHIDKLNQATIGLSILLLSLGIGLRKLMPRIPTSLVLLVVGGGLTTTLHLKRLGVATIGNLPQGLPMPSLNFGPLHALQALFIPALAIALIAYANTIATARSFGKGQVELVPNHEFVGLGFSNLAAGIFGGMPVSASGARTAVNHIAGGHTQVSQLVGAGAVAATLLVAAPLLRSVPNCALAVIIIIAIAGLFDIRELRSIWHAWRTEALLAIATVIGVAVLGVMQGLLLAVFLAIANLIRQSAMPYDATLGVTASGAFRDMDRPPHTNEVPGILIYRFDAPLYFANANYFRERVMHLIHASDTPTRWFLWDAETITSIDSTAGKMLVELVHELHRQHIVFAIARMKGSVRETVNSSTTLFHEFERAPHYSSLGHALEAYKSVQHSPHLTPPKEQVIVARKISSI